MGCPESLKVLQSIDDSQKSILDLLAKTTGKAELKKAKFDEWDVESNGEYFTFAKLNTLTGSAQNIDLRIPFNCFIIRVEYFSDDTTSKSFSTRVYSAGAVDVSSYDQLYTTAGNIQQPIAVEFTEEKSGLYMHSPITIRTAVSASTQNKTLTIKVTLKRL